MGIRDILVRIRIQIRTCDPDPNPYLWLTDPDPATDPTPFFNDRKAKNFFFTYCFLIMVLTHKHIIISLKFNCLLKIVLTFCFASINSSTKHI